MATELLQPGTRPVNPAQRATKHCAFRVDYLAAIKVDTGVVLTIHGARLRRTRYPGASCGYSPHRSLQSTPLNTICAAEEFTATLSDRRWGCIHHERTHRTQIERIDRGASHRAFPGRMARPNDLIRLYPGSNSLRSCAVNWRLASSQGPWTLPCAAASQESRSSLRA